MVCINSIIRQKLKCYVPFVENITLPLEWMSLYPPFSLNLLFSIAYSTVNNVFFTDFFMHLTSCMLLFWLFTYLLSVTLTLSPSLTIADIIPSEQLFLWGRSVMSITWPLAWLDAMFTLDLELKFKFDQKQLIFKLRGKKQPFETWFHILLIFHLFVCASYSSLFTNYLGGVVGWQFTNFCVLFAETPHAVAFSLFVSFW